MDRSTPIASSFVPEAMGCTGIDITVLDMKNIYHSKVQRQYAHRL
jgi:hypothetical protein